MKVENNFLHVLRPANQLLWVSLAFHAGYLNAGGFLACHRFVSHMTGAGANVGFSIAKNHYAIAFEMMMAPVFFFLGSCLAGFLVDKKILQERQPKILTGLVIIFFMNLLVLIGGEAGIFGPFGEPLIHQRDFLLLFVLTFTCGLQNGLFASLTLGQIRTTHLTGLITDLGLNFVRTIVLPDDSVRVNERLKNRLRLKTIVSFFSGSIISAVVFQNSGYHGFSGSVFISGLIILLVVNIHSLKLK